MKTKTSLLKKSFTFPALASVIVAALIAVCPTQTRANTALDFTGGIFLPGEDITVGWAFSLSSDVLLTDLGVWDGPNPDDGSGVVGDGLLQSHLVTIWEDITGNFVASAVVPAGGGALDDDFRYMSLGPTLLLAGDYVIGAFYQDEDTDVIALFGSITTDPLVTYNGSRSELGNAFPAGNELGGQNSFFGPNFQFTTELNGRVSVPEGSSTWMLMLLGLTCTFGLHLLIRRRLAAGF